MMVACVAGGILKRVSVASRAKEEFASCEAAMKALAREIPPATQATMDSWANEQLFYWHYPVI